MLQYKKQVTIDKLKEIADDNTTTLFPNTSTEFDFWAGYAANAARFDLYFTNKYSGWRFFKKYNESVSDTNILTDFKNSVDAWLFINAKKYTELYRVQVLASNAYDIVNNYDLTEEIEKTGETSGSETQGARTNSYSIGATGETNSHAYGAHTDTTSATLGQQTSNSTSGISGFNSSSFNNDTNGNITNGSRSDSGSATYAAHTDTDTITKQAQTNGETIGAQENSTSGEISENSTLHRYGNIGIQTAAQIIGGHIELWDGFSFYNMIFEDMARDFLKISDSYEVTNTYNAGGSGGGSADTSQILAAITALSDKVDAQTTTITANDNTNTTNIRGDIANVPVTLSAAISTAETNIRGDITDVSTDNY